MKYFLITIPFLVLNSFASSEVKLEWKDSPSATYIIEISKNKNISAPFIQEAIDKSPYTFEAKEPGTYYWQVKAIVDGGEPILAKEIGVIRVKLAPIRIRHKISKEEDTAGKKQVEFFWKNDSSFKTYTFKIEQLEKRQSTVFLEKDFKNVYKFETGLPAGRYRWFVEQKKSDGVVLQKSKSKIITIKEKKIIPKKKVVKKKPEPHTLWELEPTFTEIKNEDAILVDFRWKETPNLKSKFSFYIYKGKSINGLYEEIYSDSVDAPSKKIKLLPGNYLWKVSTIPQDDRPMVQIPPIKIKVEKP